MIRYVLCRPQLGIAAVAAVLAVVFASAALDRAHANGAAALAGSAAAAVAGSTSGAAAGGGSGTASSGGNDQTSKTNAYALAPASPHTSDRGAALPQAFGLFTLPHEWESARMDADLAAVDAFAAFVTGAGATPGHDLSPGQIGVLNAFARLNPAWCATVRGLPDWGGYVAACE